MYHIPTLSEQYNKHKLFVRHNHELYYTYKTFHILPLFTFIAWNTETKKPRQYTHKLSTCKRSNNFCLFTFRSQNNELQTTVTTKNTNYY